MNSKKPVQHIAFHVFLACCTVLPAQSMAAEAVSPIAEMNRLTSSGQFRQAYDLGNANLADWEGDPGFDFFYGLAALESGEPNDAIFALERVVATTREATVRERARLELARAYFLTNNLTASENLFNTVLATNPPDNVRQNIEAFIQLIETRRDAQRQSWEFSVASSFGSDDNINSATSNGLIDTPLIGQIELNQDGTQTDDIFSNTTFNMGYRRPFSRDAFLSATLNLNHLDNIDTDQFDLDTARAEVAYNWGGQVNRFRHGVTYSRVLLDQEGFQDAYGLNSSWQRAGSNGWYQSLSGSFSQLRYDTSAAAPQNNLRDVDQLLLTGGLTKLSENFTHSFNLYHADESPKSSGVGKHNGRSFSGLAYSVLYRFNQQHTPFLRVSIQDVDHDDRHPVFFNTTRSDSTDSLTLGWIWQLNRQLTITGDAAYTDNQSNIPLFEYTRFKYQAGFRFQF